MDITDNSSLTNLTRTSGVQLSPVVPAVMFASGVFGNLLALVILYRSSRSRKRTIFYKLVGFLSFVDLIGTIALSPVTLVQYSKADRWYGGQALCDYFSFMMIFFGYSSMFIVSIMALDRYIALIHPYFYSSKYSWTRIKIVTAGSLIFAAMFAALPIIGVGSNVIHFPYTWCFFNCKGTSITGAIFSYSYSGIGFLVIIFLAFTNITVIGALTKMHIVAHSRKTPCRNLHVCISSEEVQMIMFSVGVVMVFAGCWAPLMAVIVLEQSQYMTFGEKLELYVIRLASLNQILDPWIYLLFRKELFKIFTNMLKKYLCKTNGKLSVSGSQENKIEIMSSMTHGSLPEVGLSECNLNCYESKL